MCSRSPSERASNSSGVMSTGVVPRPSRLPISAWIICGLPSRPFLTAVTSPTFTPSALWMGAPAKDGWRCASCTGAGRSSAAAAWQRGDNVARLSLMQRTIELSPAHCLLDIAPACLGHPADALHGLLDISRGVEQRQLALVAKLVRMGLHAQ